MERSISADRAGVVLPGAGAGTCAQQLRQDQSLLQHLRGWLFGVARELHESIDAGRAVQWNGETAEARVADADRLGRPLRRLVAQLWHGGLLTRRASAA